MKIFLTSVISVILIFVAIKQFLTSRTIVSPDKNRMKKALYVDLALICHVICYAVSDMGLSAEIPSSLMIGLMSLSLISMSNFSIDDIVLGVVVTTVTLEVIFGIWTLLSSMYDLPVLYGEFYVTLSVISCCITVVAYIYGIYIRLRDVKYVMKSCSVWTNVTMSIDSIYLASILLTTIWFGYISASNGGDNAVCVTAFTIMYLLIYVALSVRILKSSAFIFMTDHERRIIESMKISHVETTHESAGTEMLYKSLYDRVLEYFTEYKPYLNPNLSINDVVEVVFSNKLYISRAISQYTGRNFCQFVNYYRVAYAVELYRSNSNLKVSDLATRSGFNSVVSFGMAFRLYMGEKPGDWCRREKYRLEKLKK